MYLINIYDSIIYDSKKKAYIINIFPNSDYLINCKIQIFLSYTHSYVGIQIKSFISLIYKISSFPPNFINTNQIVIK